ncbi:MAG: hypothetical protein NWE76_07550, partial [Candidatus Bathyarchaeota archaeon]|nr:hypothetical protein [Candidatus Bathyarchaeota archaeon]
MPNFLKINDLVTFSLMDENLIKVRDDFQQGLYQPQPGAQDQSGLLIRIAATHAGIVTRNNGFYLPQMMKDGAKTFLDNYGKPILLHHDDHNDAIGRIVQSGYVDTSGSIQDRLRQDGALVVKDRLGKEKGQITDELLQKFIDGSMPFGMQVDFVHTLLMDSLLEDRDYEGLGHIQIVARITDKAAIEKFLDGRYLTGSVGATTNRAVCSICKQDWTDSGQCEHKPGGIYEGSKCFIIAGRLMYDEYSVVNVPADRHSRVLELNYNGATSVIDFANEYSGRTYETRLEFPQYDPTKEEGSMPNNNKDEKTVKDSQKTSPENKPEATPEEKKVQDHVEGTPPAAEGEGTPEKKVADGSAKPEGTPAEGETKVTDASGEENSLDGLVDKILDSQKLDAEEEDKFYDALWAEAEAGFADGEFTLEELGVEKLEDAKLSTEKRKKLAKSTFCGPEKSFPVPDCAHVTAARRLIGRYKGEGDKSKILACVTRK